MFVHHIFLFNRNFGAFFYQQIKQHVESVVISATFFLYILYQLMFTQNIVLTSC